MSVLADQLEAVILERGPLPGCTLARELYRRTEVVFETLHSDPRFVQTGKTKASLWSTEPARSFDVQEAAEHFRKDAEMVQEFIFGQEGFLELGLVASVNGNGRVRVTERGLAISHHVGSLDSGVAP